MAETNPHPKPPISSLLPACRLGVTHHHQITIIGYIFLFFYIVIKRLDVLLLLTHCAFATSSDVELKKID
jgi:hypothetical protein